MAAKSVKQDWQPGMNEASVLLPGGLSWGESPAQTGLILYLSFTYYLYYVSPNTL